MAAFLEAYPVHPLEAVDHHLDASLQLVTAAFAWGQARVVQVAPQAVLAREPLFHQVALS